MVHGGVYREWVKPPRGGTSEGKRIVYRAVPGEEVIIKGSEVIKGWKRFRGDVWKVIIPNTFFGDFNPYREVLHGDWFNDKGRIHHPGEVYLNGHSLYEAPLLEALLSPELLQVGEEQLLPWYCESDRENTYLYANFGNHDPNKEEVEINVRQSCFYPVQPGINYITVTGFVMRQAATPWAPPTAEQPGLLGTHWSKGWIIEDNIISDSKCVGITLGKDRKSGQNVWSKNPCIDGATHYNEVIFRALKEGWSKETIGSHIVRNNEISRCEQAGIVGSLGAVFSQIYDNHIYNIWVKRLFTGAEIAGIKIHAAVDAVIRHNRIHNTGRGIWLDWMAQGTRVTRNLLYDNTEEDLFIEVSHGPFLVDNNVFLSRRSLRNWSEGGAFVHNLFAGSFEVHEEMHRFTPYLFPHSTQVAGLHNTWNGQQRFYNNLFLKNREYAAQKIRKGNVYHRYGWGLQLYDSLDFQVLAAGNVYLDSIFPCRLGAEHLVIPSFDTQMKTERSAEHILLYVRIPDEMLRWQISQVTSALLGVTKISHLSFEDAQGRPIKIDTDYFGRMRKENHPVAGPFEIRQGGGIRLDLW